MTNLHDTIQRTRDYLEAQGWTFYIEGELHKPKAHPEVSHRVLMRFLEEGGFGGICIHPWKLIGVGLDKHTRVYIHEMVHALRGYPGEAKIDEYREESVVELVVKLIAGYWESDHYAGVFYAKYVNLGGMDSIDDLKSEALEMYEKYFINEEQLETSGVL